MNDKTTQPLFTVIYEDGTTYVGGESYQKTLWLDIPKKQIKRIFYLMPSGDYICLGGYEKYFHMIEATQDWMRVGFKKTTSIDSKPKLEYAYIMGLRNKKVTSYRITLLQKKDGRYKVGDVIIRTFDINSKFIQGLNVQNWR